jgi:VanZ family protein
MNAERRAPVRFHRAWLLWLAFVALWTTALLVPVPTRAPVLGEISSGWRPIIAKSVHVLGYATFTFLSGLLPLPGRLRLVALFFLMAHGTVTEMLQTLTETRTGQLTDVGWDNLGVGLGLLASWRWWAAPERTAVSRPLDRSTAPDGGD